MATVKEAEANAWVHAYADELFGFLMARLRDEATAKDLLQDSLLAAWRSRDTYQEDKPVRAWLYTIVRRKLIDHYRKEASRQKTSADLEEGIGPYFDEEAHWAKGFYPQDWSTAADSRVSSAEFYQILNGCSQKLKAAQGAVFSMKYLDDLDSKEICTQLGITEGHFWVLMHRAKVQLRACLEKNWFLSSTSANKN